MDYEDWAIRHDFRKHLPAEFLELMFGDDEFQVPIVEDDPTEGDTPT
jgi:hypothetical protein